MGNVVHINLQTGQASGAPCLAAANPAGVQVNPQSGQALGLVPSVQTCAQPAPACAVGAGIVMQGQPGADGPPGPAGGNYEHIQLLAASAWTVNHNLGYRPSVNVLSMGGMEMLAEVLHTSLNQVLIYFDQPTAGIAVVN